MLASLQLFPQRITNPQTYPFTVPTIASLTHFDFSSSRITFFTGENGSGKSTLLEAIALSYGLSLDGGHIHPIAYEDTPSFQITRRFLDDPAAFVEKLTEP